MEKIDQKNQSNWLLARHGKSKHNLYKELGDEKEATFAGGRIDTDLTEKGKEETILLAKKIVKKDLPDLIIQSALKRSKQTAKILQKEIYKNTKTKIRITTSKYLHEVDVGDFTGKTKNEVLKEFPVEAKAFYEGEIESWSFPNGENYKSIVERYRNLVSEISKKTTTKPLVIGHGIFNRVILHEKYPLNTKLWKETHYPHDRIIEINNHVVDKIKQKEELISS